MTRRKDVRWKDFTRKVVVQDVYLVPIIVCGRVCGLLEKLFVAFDGYHVFKDRQGVSWNE